MLTVISVLHVLVSIGLILVILLQAGKGADLGAMLGGAGSHTMFGAGGAGNFLTKMTTGIAVAFMLTCMGLAYLSARSGTVTDKVDAVAPAALPVAGAPAPGTAADPNATDPNAAAPAPDAAQPAADGDGANADAAPAGDPAPVAGPAGDPAPVAAPAPADDPKTQ
jgi:preprotein translocase subunit SecG